MAVTQVEYLTVDGERYMVLAEGEQSSFRRYHQPVEAGQIQGKRVQSPFVDAEQIGFETGEGMATGADDVTGYLEAEGMEPVDEVPTSGHLRLKVGRQLVEIKSDAGAGGYIAFAIYADKLYALRRSEAVVDEYDGSTWTARDFSAALTGGALGTSMVGTSSRLLIGTNDNQRVVEYNGAAFTAFQLAAAAGSIYVWAWSHPTSKFWVARVSTDVDIYTYTIGGTFSAEGSTGADLTHFCCGTILGGSLFYATRRDMAKGPHAALFSATDTAVDIGQQFLGSWDDSYPLCAAAYRGAVYFGMAWGGSIQRWDGSKLVEVGHFGATAAPATLPGTDAIWALFPFGDSLYAAGYDASAASGARTWLRRYKLDDEGVGGWHLISVGGDDASIAVRALAAFQQTLVLGDQEATNGKVYEHSKTARLTAASLTTPDFDYGAPALSKRFRGASVRHDPLLAGQAVELRYGLDGATVVSLGTNRDVGATETVFDLPESVRGARLRLAAHVTNGAAQDLIVSAAAVRCIPAPDALEVREATLRLDNEDGAWEDGTADPYDALTKYEALNALKLATTPFQVVDPFRENGLPTRATIGLFDPQVPLQWRLLAGPDAPRLFVPVRILQAGQPPNLLLNASFEQDADGAAPTSWSTTGTGTASNVDDAEALDGSKSLKVEFNGAAASYGRTQAVAGLVPGRYYTVSGSIKRATSGGVVKIRAFESGVLDATTDELADDTDSDFIRYSKPFLLPTTSSGTISVQLLGTGTPAGHVWYDAIQLEESVPASTFRERGSGG